MRDKYGDERRTDISAVSGEVDIEDLIPVEDCVLTLTRMGYICLLYTSFKADAEIFTETTEYDLETLQKRLREQAFLKAGLSISLTEMCIRDRT